LLFNVSIPLPQFLICILKIDSISEIMAEKNDAARKKWKMAKFRPTMDFGKVI
jgi:hypothetical protein